MRDGGVSLFNRKWTWVVELVSFHCQTGFLLVTVRRNIHINIAVDAL